MKITFDTLAGEKLVNLLCEIDALVETGDLQVGISGISPDAAKFCKLFHRGTSGPVIEVVFTDGGLNLTPTQ